MQLITSTTIEEDSVEITLTTGAIMETTIKVTTEVDKTTRFQTPLTKTPNSNNKGNSQIGGRQNRRGRGGNNSQREGKHNSSFLQGLFCKFCGKKGH